MLSRYARCNEVNAIRYCSRPGRFAERLRWSAFTLLEVLVVVAVIALLVSILLPSLSRARWQAKVVACRGGLHNLGNAFQMYAQTSNSYFPRTPDASTDTFCALYRARLLGDPDTVICPATRNRVRPETLPKARKAETEHQSDLHYVADRGPTDSSGGHSYEYNGCYNQDDGFPLSRKNKRTSTFLLPAHEMMLVHDSDEDFTGSDLGCRPVALSSDMSSGNNCPQPWDNHGETGMNMMFGDGHSRWLKKMEGTLIDMRKASGGNLPPPVRSVNAEIEKVWLKSQYPWRYRRR